MVLKWIISTLKALKRELIAIPKIIRCLFYNAFYADKTIILKGYVCSNIVGKNLHFNWGDDINEFFISEATGKKVLVYPDTCLSRLFPLKNYLCIGSIISLYSMKHTEVWGSGLINDVMYQKVVDVPKKVLAVRGPLTREWLMKQGIECPEVYGDPALLLSKFYTPKALKRYRIGLIPHYADLENENVKRWLQREDVKLISMQGYDKWTDIIDEMYSCDLIISSSLHGLIVSEAYQIPSVWVKFQNYVDGWDFKYHDFYASMGKEHVSCINVEADTQLENLCTVAQSWQPGKIDLEPLLDSCPFELRSIL